MLLLARWVVPVASPPIENGAVLVENDRIVFVGADPRVCPGPVLNLSDSTLLPGLVNAHCHLGFRPPSPLPLPQGERGTVNFTEWVKHLSGAHTGAPLQNIINRLIQTGTTTLADHSSPDTPPFKTPFRRVIFWEVLGADRERARRSFEAAKRRAAEEGGFVTPHSLYGVHKDILGRVLSLRKTFVSPPLADDPKVSLGPPVLSFHLLESADEDQFFRKGTGPLADYVRERAGPSLDSTEGALRGRLRVRLRRTWRGRREPLLLIHGNYLNDEEIALLQRLGAGVIHCPGSHRFFGHRRFPLEELRKRGVRIALGTDSLASNEDLSMLREMRLLKGNYPSLSHEEILQMATMEGAKALGMEKEIGTIEVGKKADLIAVKGDLLEAEEVVFSMIDGKVLFSDV